MFKIHLTSSYREAVASAAIGMARDEPTHIARQFFLAAGAAVERICENPGIGRALGSGMRSHALDGYLFAVICEVTDVEICFLHLAPTPPQ